MLNEWNKPSTMLLAIVSTAFKGTGVLLTGSPNTTVQGQLELNPIPTTEEVMRLMLAACLNVI